MDLPACLSIPYISKKSQGVNYIFQNYFHKSASGKYIFLKAIYQQLVLNNFLKFNPLKILFLKYQ